MISTLKKYGYLFSSLIFILLLISGCSSSKKVEKTVSEIKKSEQKVQAEKTASFISGVNLADYRTKLSDIYSTMNNKVPDAFKPLPSQKEHIVSNSGYRVQIISTDNKDKAEDVLHKFNDWIFEQNDITYKAMAYIIFKQPYYRVQIGDFLSKKNAIKYSRKVKRKYPGAWIVQDKINPNMTPAKMEKDNNNKNNGN
ncbi:MAG TPA: SPOR domain-containing protein [Balneolaceae bacterium]|nr:SPOR domain-containing protein [Balneolales bacterium]HKK45059.1 SPOR domain-containing protein [Balneolaceae bacterium]